MSKLPLRQISEQHIEPSSDFAKLEQNLETVKDVSKSGVFMLKTNLLRGLHYVILNPEDIF